MIFLTPVLTAASYKRIEPMMLTSASKAGEATDKGSINQRMVLKNRAALVDELYAGTPTERVMVIDERQS